MCHSVLHSDFEQALSFTDWPSPSLLGWLVYQSECFHLHMSIGTLQPEPDISPGQAFCLAQTDSQAIVKLDGLSALLSSATL